MRAVLVPKRDIYKLVQQKTIKGTNITEFSPHMRLIPFLNDFKKKNIDDVPMFMCTLNCTMQAPVYHVFTIHNFQELQAL